PTGTVTEEVIMVQGEPEAQPGDRRLQRPLVRGGDIVTLPSLAASRELLRDGLIAIPWEGLKLSPGDPTVPVLVLR
ncbi:MAG: nicotinate phosphoribosyltransferase, partial [Stackebrandtia sp.]